MCDSWTIGLLDVHPHYIKLVSAIKPTLPPLATDSNGLCECSTRSIIPDTHPCLAVSTSHSATDFFLFWFFYGAINARRKNKEGWFCGLVGAWVAAQYKWEWEQSREEITERPSSNSIHIGDIYSINLEYCKQTEGQTWPCDLTEQIISCESGPGSLSILNSHYC